MAVAFCKHVDIALWRKRDEVYNIAVFAACRRLAANDEFKIGGSFPLSHGAFIQG